MTRRKIKWAGEGYIELNFLARDWPITWVSTLGIGCIPPGAIELVAVNDPFRVVVLKVNPEEEERESRATSDGEFTRVGTCVVEKNGAPEVRLTLESNGNTR